MDSYEAKNLAWKGGQWRTLLSAETAQIHGFPPGAVRPQWTQEGEEALERKANCALGNGFHCPSLMLIMLLLLQAVGASATSPSTLGTPAQEMALIKRTTNTVFDDHFLRAVPGIMTSDACVDDMVRLL